MRIGGSQAGSSAASGSFGSRVSKTCSSDVVLVGTSAGSVGLVVPLNEKVYRRLLVLQQLLSAVVPTVCGLNPREFRLLRREAHKHERFAVFEYLCLDCVMQDEIAAAIAVSVDLLLETLRERDSMGMVF